MGRKRGIQRITPVLLKPEVIAFYADNPVNFVVEVIGVTPEPYQAEILNSVRDNRITTVKSGHGIGKSALESWQLQQFLYTRPHPRVPCTAPTQHQLHDILWAEAKKWLDRSLVGSMFQWTAERIYHKAHPETWWASARTASKGDALQGIHEGHVLYIIDESSGVKDDIFEPALGALTEANARLLACGNPNYISGWFYDFFNKRRHMANCFTISSEDSARVSSEYINMIVEMYGRDSDVFRVRVAGEFPKAQADSWIPLDWVERNSLKQDKRPIALGHPLRVYTIDLGVDVARFGDDDSVICTVYNKDTAGIQDRPIEIHGNDVMQVTGHVVARCKELHSKYPNLKIKVKIDCDGLGVGVFDRLKEIIREQQLYYILAYECHFGASGGKAHQVEFENSTGLMWGEIREKLRTNKLTLWYHDDQISQLSTRTYSINSRGEIAMERKADMKKRGLKSPDLADALGLALYDPQRTTVVSGNYR